MQFLILFLLVLESTLGLSVTGLNEEYQKMVTKPQSPSSELKPGRQN